MNTEHLTKEQIVQTLKKTLIAKNARLNLCLEIHNAIRDTIAAKWTGKKINERFTQQLRDRLGITAESPEVIYLRIKFGMCTIYAWGGRFCQRMDDRIAAFLGYDSKSDARSYVNLTVAGFEESDEGNGQSAANAILQNTSALSDGESLLEGIADAMLAVKTAEQRLDAATCSEKCSCIHHVIAKIMGKNI